MTAQFWQALALGRTAQKAVVPDANKAFRQNVLRNGYFGSICATHFGMTVPLISV
jgi:hypothetical protein